MVEVIKSPELQEATDCFEQIERIRELAEFSGDKQLGRDAQINHIRLVLRNARTQAQEQNNIGEVPFG